MLVSGNLRKMVTELSGGVKYQLPLDEARIDLNALLGTRVAFEFGGVINCVHCDRKTKKSFSQGFCYPCFRRLAACDKMFPKKINGYSPQHFQNFQNVFHNMTSQALC